MFLIEDPSYRGFCALSAINTSSVTSNKDSTPSGLPHKIQKLFSKNLWISDGGGGGGGDS